MMEATTIRQMVVILIYRYLPSSAEECGRLRAAQKEKRGIEGTASWRDSWEKYSGVRELEVMQEVGSRDGCGLPKAQPKQGAHY